MAIQPRQAQGAFVTALTAFLLNEFRELGQVGARRVAQAVQRQIVEAGEATAEAFRNGAREGLTWVNNRVRQRIQDEVGNLQQFGQFLQDFYNSHTEELALDENGDVVMDTPPDLGDLIPENDTGGAQVGQKRPREPMEPGDEQALTARAAAPGGANTVSKETPISQYPSLSYGLQETHTTILPFRTWFSGGYLDHDTPLQAKFRMNSIYDMVGNAYTTLATSGTIGAKAFHTLPVGPGGVHTSGAVFPQTPNSGANERPQWRDFWAGLYTHYTVLGCKYKITVVNVNNARGADIVVGVQMDSYTDASTATGNIMPLTKYSETLALEHRLVQGRSQHDRKQWTTNRSDLGNIQTRIHQAQHRQRRRRQNVDGNRKHSKPQRTAHHQLLQRRTQLLHASQHSIQLRGGTRLHRTIQGPQATGSIPEQRRHRPRRPSTHQRHQRGH